MSDKSKKTDFFNRLLRKFQATQDDRFLDTFFRRIKGIVFRHFLDRNVNYEQIENAFQDAAIYLIRKPDCWDENRSPAIPFFLMLVRSSLRDEWIKWHRRQRLGPTFRFSDLATSPTDRGDMLESILNIKAREENGPLLDEVEREQVRELVCELPAKKFQVAAGICFEELRPIQIAAKLGVSRRVVSLRLKSLKPYFTKLPAVQRAYALDPDSKA